MTRYTLAAIAIAALIASPVWAQSTTGDPAASSANRGIGKTDLNGSGTSTSGGRDANNDQGRDKTGRTGLSADQKQPSEDRSPGAANVTGQQKAGTNAEGTGKP